MSAIMKAPKFPTVGTVIQKRRSCETPEHNHVSHAMVTRSEPERGFIILLDDETMETEKVRVELVSA